MPDCRSFAALVLCLGLIRAIAPAQQIAFHGPRTYDVGQGPAASALADFDHDGTLDLAVATSTGLSILRGQGDTTFHPAVTLNIRNLSHVTTADFNGDGNPDLAATDALSDSVKVVLGNGDGTFQSPLTAATGRFPLCAAAGDINSDQRIDLVVANSADGTVSILLGNGDGTFRVENTIALPPAQDAIFRPGPQFVALGDLNGDGRLDLAVAKFVNDFHEVNGLFLFAGNGDGTFQPHSSYALPFGAMSIAMSDFNGDHIVDLAVGNYYAASVTVLIGRGGGAFRIDTSYRVITASHVTVTDQNGDGVADLVVADNLANAVAVLPGNGDGSFGPVAKYHTGTFPTFVSAADLNGDGSTDLVVVNSGSYDVAVLAGQPGRSFLSAASYAVEDRPNAMAVADFNGDGHLDLAVATESKVAVLLGRGDTTFDRAGQVTAGSNPIALASADFNSDGLADLVVANQQSKDLSLLLGDGDGSFHKRESYELPFPPTAVVIADFNADGVPDIAATAFQPGGAGVFVLLGKGDGSFQPAVRFDSGTQPTAAATGDFNADGHPDLAVANLDSVTILLGHGDGTFDPPQFSGGQDLFLLTSLAVADLNGDGIVDLAVGLGFESYLAVLPGRGDGTFDTPKLFPNGRAATGLAVADFDADGHPDLTVAESWGQVAVLTSGAPTLLYPPVKFAADVAPRAVVTGDFDEDGRPDIAVANFNAFNVIVLRNRTEPIRP